MATVEVTAMEVDTEEATEVTVEAMAAIVEATVMVADTEEAMEVTVGATAMADTAEGTVDTEVTTARYSAQMSEIVHAVYNG